MKIIVRAPNWVGDCVLATPFLKLLREKNPQAVITVLAKSPGDQIFLGNPSINHVIACSSFGQAVSVLRQENYDQGYLLPNSFSSALLFALGKIPERIGYIEEMRGYFLTEGVEWRGEVEPRAVRYARLINPRAFQDHINPQTHPCELALEAAALQEAQEILKGINAKKIVAINPCSNAPSRRWPAKRYAALARKLADNLGVTVVILGGPGSQDQNLARQIVEGSPSPLLLNLCGKTSLKGLGAILKKVNVLITSDTGIMHVAAAVQTPLLVLAGAGDMKVTGPWTTSRFTILDKHVLCSPCVKNNCINRESPMICMESISVDEVLTSAQDFL